MFNGKPSTSHIFGPPLCQQMVLLNRSQLITAVPGDGCTSASELNQLRRRATFVSATLQWMNGASFEECSDAAGGSEYDGILARVLRRTHLMLKQLDMAFQLCHGGDWWVMVVLRLLSCVKRRRQNSWLSLALR